MRGRAKEPGRLEPRSPGKLERILLEAGGERVVMPQIEEDLKQLLSERAVLLDPDQIGLKLMPGRPSQCHANASRLWEEGVGEIMTGYALSGDGIWRQHSWIRAGEKLIETTEPRELYFGFALDSDEAEEFSLINY